MSAGSVACVFVREPTGDRPYRPDRSTARREEEEGGIGKQSVGFPAAGSQVSDDMAADDYKFRSAAMAALISSGWLKPVPEKVLKRPLQSVKVSMRISDASVPSFRVARTHAVSTAARLPTSSAYVSAAKVLWIIRRCRWEPLASRRLGIRRFLLHSDIFHMPLHAL